MQEFCVYRHRTLLAARFRSDPVHALVNADKADQMQVENIALIALDPR